MTLSARPPFTKRRRVFVTGVGCLSSIGASEAETVLSLREGRSGIRPVESFSTQGCMTSLAGEVPEDFLAGSEYHPLSSSAHRASHLLWRCWETASLRRPGFQPDAACFGTTSGGMSYGENFFCALQQQDSLRIYRQEVREYVPQKAAFDLVQSAGWDIAPVIVSNACASGTNAIGQAFQWVAHGLASRVICGGYDPLAQLVFAGFNALKALSLSGVCRPFDAHRDGLLLGEGAAVLLLESEDTACRSGVCRLAEIVGYGTATDNHHLTQPEPGGSGPLAAMERALADAHLAPEQVDYINAHGTATLFNDASEAAAIARLFPGVRVSSTKALTGHTLGAAGAIEAAFSIYALQNGFCPPQWHCPHPDPACDVRLVHPEETPRPPRCILSNSFGFGGSNASIILRYSEN